MKALLMNEENMRRTLTRMAHEIIERCTDTKSLALVGVQRRGALLSDRLRSRIGELSGNYPDCGSIDISYYRDDLDRRDPVYRGIQLPFSIQDRPLILVDVVLFTGRTCRAAMEALFFHGRPASVQLAVLIDRGHRELPFRADYVGKNIPTALSESVKVCMREEDGVDAVFLCDKDES